MTDLSAARLVPLAPQVPLAGIAGFGDLLPLAAELARQLGAFSADRNLFYADEKGGRFIFGDEQLEWGARYRLLSVHEIAPSMELGPVLAWSSEGKFGGWYIYEIALPSAFIGSMPDLLQGIAEFLGHRIRSPRPRLYVVDPLPHHVEVGGAYVYPVPPESLLLRRFGTSQTSVTVTAGAVATEVGELDDGWIRLKGQWTDGCEYTVAIDGIEQVVFRVEPCELFCPAGVSVVSGDLSWNLLADAPLDAPAIVERTVSVNCGSARIAAHIARLNDSWLLEGAQLSLPGGSVKELNAGSFGKLQGVVPASLYGSVEIGAVMRNLQQLPAFGVSRWIEHLVVRDHGSEGVSRVRSYLLNPSPENLYRLGSIMTSRLMPHIRAAQYQQRDRTEGDEGL